MQKGQGRLATAWSYPAFTASESHQKRILQLETDVVQRTLNSTRPAAASTVSLRMDLRLSDARQWQPQGLHRIVGRGASVGTDFMQRWSLGVRSDGVSSEHYSKNLFVCSHARDGCSFGAPQIPLFPVSEATPNPVYEAPGASIAS
jgi:hypothetical protein